MLLHLLDFMDLSLDRRRLDSYFRKRATKPAITSGGGGSGDGAGAPSEESRKSPPKRPRVTGACVRLRPRSAKKSSHRGARETAQHQSVQEFAAGRRQLPPSPVTDRFELRSAREDGEEGLRRAVVEANPRFAGIWAEADSMAPSRAPVASAAKDAAAGVADASASSHASAYSHASADGNAYANAAAAATDVNVNVNANVNTSANRLATTPAGAGPGTGKAGGVNLHLVDVGAQKAIMEDIERRKKRKPRQGQDEQKVAAAAARGLLLSPRQRLMASSVASAGEGTAPNTPFVRLAVGGETPKKPKVVVRAAGERSDAFGDGRNAGRSPVTKVVVVTGSTPQRKSPTKQVYVAGSTRQGQSPTKQVFVAGSARPGQSPTKQVFVAESTPQGRGGGAGGAGSVAGVVGEKKLPLEKVLVGDEGTSALASTAMDIREFFGQRR